ncbi:MAG TPA: phosphotransferase [bacterium]|jgi:aminoglycoside phosphotransferase (APT) family kinase protein
MMHPGEIPIDESLVVKLLHARFPSWANLPLRKVESTGTEYALFRLGDDMVVRLPRVEQFSKNIQKEHTWLPKLAPHLPVPVPKPLAKGQPSGYFPFEWSIYNWIEGEAVSFNYRSDPEALAMDLADFNKALRNIDPADGPP